MRSERNPANVMAFIYKATLTCLIVLFCFTWLISQTIPPERRAEAWKLVGVEGGIPSFSNRVNYLDEGGINDGDTDNSSILQQLVNRLAGSETVILVPAGDYFFSKQVRLPRHGKIIIRGEGPDRTRFLFDTGNIGFIGDFDVAGGVVGDDVDVLSGFTKGSTQLLLSSAAGFNTGDYLDIDQENDVSLMSSTNPPDWNQSWAARSVGQIVMVKGISGNRVAIDPPLRYDYNPGLNVEVNKIFVTEFVGFEDFYLENLRAGDKFNFYFANTANCWIKNVHSIMTVKYHVAARASKNMTIRDSYFSGSFDVGGGGHGYGAVVEIHTSDCLIENNIFGKLRHSMMSKVGANGNVFAYNYSLETMTEYGLPSPDISIHGHFSYMNLFEGNIVDMLSSADFWGPSGFGTTFFRNRITRGGAWISDSSIENNLVGNEITSSFGIAIDEKAIDTFIHGNNHNDEITWTAGVDEILVKSHYLSSEPSFWETNTMWPSIGPEYEIGSGTIPAKERYWNNFTTSIELAEQSLPASFGLAQNYPNPFNPTTTISYSIPQTSRVVLTIYNLLGQEVKTLVNEIQIPGNKWITWDSRDNQDDMVGSGVYIYSIRTATRIETRKMVRLP
jgi:hypothetical protein